MPQIRLLSEKMIELISAGEVIDRPASIVKELVENALDAGASKITVEIQNGGISYIRVTDNGCGIIRAQLPTAFLRHATSKVRDEKDLYRIASLGFRGEALASIAAMCKVEVLTRNEAEEVGTRYVIEGSVEKECSDAGCPVGTTFVVRDVFYNTPARMKFLKKDVTESNAIAAILDKLALSNPAVSFKFIRNGEIKLHTPGDGLLSSCIYAVFGREFYEGVTEVNYNSDGFVVHGFISKPAFSKNNRALQAFFVNGRYVHSKTCMVALEEAYKGSLMAGRFPVCVLNIDLPTDFVDVNVHPTKLEVRFAEEKPVFSAVYYACKSALSMLEREKAASFQPKERMPAQKEQPEGGNTKRIPFDWMPQHNQSYEQNTLSQHPVAVLDPPPSSEPQTVLRSFTSVYQSDERQHHKRNMPQTEIAYESPVPHEQPFFTPLEPAVPEEDAGEETRIIGELFATYILCERGENLILVDKHAAHERILYERLVQNEDVPQRQILLAPIASTLTREEHGVLCQQPETLEKLGFLVEDFGGSAVLIREIPVMMRQCDAEASVQEIARKLLQNQKNLLPQVIDDLYHSIACRSAIKAHDKNSTLELRELMQILKEEPDIRFCPHGRPIFIRVSKKEIEKLFGRLG